MNKGKEWFQNHSLRFKIVVLLLGVVFVLQVVNGLIFTSIVSKKFEENISESNLGLTRQMVINLNQALEDIVNKMVPIRDEILSNQLLTESMDSQNSYISRNITYQEMFNQLISADSNYQFINSMLILNKDNQNYSFVLDEYLQLNQDQLFQKILEDNQLSRQCQWSGIIPDSYFFTRSKEEIVSIIMPIYRYGEIKDLLLVNLKVEAIQRYMEKLDGSENLLLLQLHEKDVLSAKEKEEQIDKEMIEAVINRDNPKETDIIGVSVVISSSLDINQWKLYMITPKSTISSSAKVLSQFIITIIFTTGIVLVICVSYIVFIVTKPIKKMTEIMEANRHTKQISHRFNPKYRDEVGVLANTYNQLMDEIGQLMEDIEREQIENRKSYLRMLQMQIKPHFLYNTLEAAKFLVEMEDPNGVEMLSAVGRFYKLSLSGIYDRVEMREEIEHLSCYLQILKLRYTSKYDYSIQVEEQIMGNEIIKFSLQPLVENAVYHGIKMQRRKGFIKIKGRRIKEEIVITIWDDGVGIPGKKLVELQEQLAQPTKLHMAEHIGIINVHQRIRVQYGEPYGVTIESQEDKFTKVDIHLPERKYII